MAEQVKCTFVESFTPAEAVIYLKNVDWSFTMNFNDKIIRSIKTIIKNKQVDLAIVVAIAKTADNANSFTVVGGINSLKAILEENKSSPIVIVEYRIDDIKELPELYVKVNQIELPKKPGRPRKNSK